ncbi:MAG: hypothetical protein AB7D06_17860 [Pedobacter sp.]
MKDMVSMTRLAITSILFTGILILVAGSFFGSLDQWAGVQWSRLPLHILIGAIWGFFGSFGLWIWMLTDFFKRKELKQRVLWGWMLIIGNYATAALYFLFIFVPDHIKRQN